MTNILLSDDVEARVAQEASRRGVDFQTLALELIEQGLPRPTTPMSPGNAATAELLEQWMAEDADADPAELERQRLEGEEFMRNLDRNRRRADGSRLLGGTDKVDPTRSRDENLGPACVSAWQSKT